jgi:hypothetical protein
LLAPDFGTTRISPPLAYIIIIYYVLLRIIVSMMMMTMTTMTTIVITFISPILRQGDLLSCMPCLL